MRIIPMLICFTIISSCKTSDFTRFSKNIERNCIGKQKRPNITTFHDLRIKLYHDQKLNFINFYTDTLFLLESVDIESGTLSGRIWNNTDAINYDYNGSFEFSQIDRFEIEVCELVNKWNIDTIRKRESMSAIHLPERYIHATKIIISEGRENIECLAFLEFY